MVKDAKTEFDWSAAASLLKNFGGESVQLHVRKTGLPFFDALQLYGAIDLYIGLREDVDIRDAGTEWDVRGSCRTHRLRGRDETLLKQVRQSNLKPKPPRNLNNEEYCQHLRSSLVSGSDTFGEIPNSLHQANGPFSEFDSAMQSGVRGIAAASYDTIRSGQSSAPECIATVPLSQGLLALAGKIRTVGDSAADFWRVADITFLPVFEGQIDLSKVVSPVRASLACANAVCAQALMLLALKTSLFAEGYQDRLRSVVYNKRVTQGDFAYSGQIDIGSTAAGRIRSASFGSHVNEVFRSVVRWAWGRKDPKFVPDALTMARWVLEPVPKNLSALITSQERLKARGHQQIFTDVEYVKEVWAMAYGEWPGGTGNIQKFARAVAMAIYYGRMEGEDDPSKRWYDEVATLRSAPNDKAFFNRVLNLLELGHRYKPFVGAEEQQRYDPGEVMKAAGNDFETFRDLFRMFLIQESRPTKRPSVADIVSAPVADENLGERTEAREGEEVEE